MHGQRGGELAIEAEHDGNTPTFKLSFPFRNHFKGETSTTPAARLYKLMQSDLQNMADRCPDSNVPSHGTGLYLANLAVAVVGWKLVIQKIEVDDRVVDGKSFKGLDGKVGNLQFRLSKEDMHP
jgi:hypothetical protein